MTLFKAGLLASILVLSACVTPPPAPSNLTQFTAADFANAIRIAQKSTAPEAPLFVTCFSWAQTQLAALQPPVLPSGTIGLATGAVIADLTLNDLGSINSSEMQVAYATNCGPLQIFLVNRGASMGTRFAGLTAALSK